MVEEEKREVEVEDGMREVVKLSRRSIRSGDGLVPICYLVLLYYNPPSTVIL